MAIPVEKITVILQRRYNHLFVLANKPYWMAKEAPQKYKCGVPYQRVDSS